MKPSRDSALVDLLDRILVKGVVLHADIIITVAEIPLIGINLRAAIAGIKTMLDYGMMEAWDEKIRRIALEEGQEPSLNHGETVIYRTHVTFRTDGKVKTVWMHGHLYLTNLRLIIVRRNPWESLLEIEIDRMNEIKLVMSKYLTRDRVTLQISNKSYGGSELSVRIISSDVKTVFKELEQLAGIYKQRKLALNV